MTREEVKGIIEALVEKYEGDFDPPVERLDEPFAPPTRGDWEFLEAKFGCSFGPEFVAFMELMSGYNCPGVLNVTREGRTNDDPTVDWSYDHEMSFGRWDADLIPFLDVGNDDYFCLSAGREPRSPVFYVYHETGESEQLTDSFEGWLKELETHLNG
jgi:hypothetical protein